MRDLRATSIQWKLWADELLQSNQLLSDLSQHGSVILTGSYAYDLMMHGDIDIVVHRPQGYTIEEVFAIFKKLYFAGQFRSYFIGGDWNDPRKGAEFPNGHYVGLKDVFADQRWKIDIWFISSQEFESRNNNAALHNLSEQQRFLILECKAYKHQNKISLASQQIYDAVIAGQWQELGDCKSFLSTL